MIPIRFSHLKAMAQSPQHFRHAQLNGKDPTMSMRIGTGAHAKIFEPHRVVVFPGRVRNGKVWDAFEAEHEGMVILNAKENATAQGIADALLGHPEARRLLLEGTTVEQQIGWESDGRQCLGTPDAYTQTHLVDLKTCRSADPGRFAWQARSMFYGAQLEWYRDGLFRAGMADIPRGSCYLIAVESAPPHPVCVFRATEGLHEMGERSIRLWWERLQQCELANEWPGYAQSTVDLDVMDDEQATELVFADEEPAGESIYDAGR